ncbi:MAG TPA: hypothetical protein VMX54_12270 [Vicinamibacteria bacterium]|nr:hypothetical protein [Vicinamibacteria bacterium]
MSKLRTVSWVLLAIAGVLALLGALTSANLAYRGGFRIAGVPIAEVAAGREAVVTGLRGARGTAAAWAAGFATLFLYVVLFPYRRGDVASWWAVLVATLVLLAVAGSRLLFTGSQAGMFEPMALAIVVLVALLLDVRRLTAHP